jgi:hypothetical protein
MKLILSLVAVAATALTSAAHAAVPASVGTTVASISADATSMFDTVFPVIGAVAALGVIATLFKRFMGKV